VFDYALDVWCGKLSREVRQTVGRRLGDDDTSLKQETL